MKLQMRLLLTVFALIITTNLFSQFVEINWQNCYGGSLFEECYDLTQTQNGYIIVGSSNSSDGDVMYNFGGSDCWLVKVDNSGGLDWVKSYGGSYGDGIFRIFHANANHFYLLCSSFSSDGDISIDPYPQSSDFWIVKIDDFGNIIWDKILGGNSDEQMWSGCLTSDGGIIAAGWTNSNDGDVSLNYGMYDMWLVKLNSSGEKEWDFSIGTPGLDFGNAIIQTSDGGYLVGGTSMMEEGGNLNCIPHSWQGEAILVKLDPDRNIEWQRCYGGTADDGIWDIKELADGYIFAGYASSNDGDITGWHGEGDIWIVKIDFNGNIIWQKCLGGYDFEFTDNIIPENDGSFTIIGSTESKTGDVTGNHSIDPDDNDIWIVRLSSEGELIWQQCIGGAANEMVRFGVLKTEENKYIIPGQTDWGPSYDVECTPYNGTYAAEYWLFEITDTTVGINEVDLPKTNIKIQPNPASSEINVIFQNTDHIADTKLECYNIYGQQVHTEKIWKGQQETRIDLRGWAKGLYFVVVRSGGKVAGTGRFVRK